MSSNAFATALLQPEKPLPVDIKGEVPKRFSVYRNNVIVGLVRATEANFPAVRKLLGEVYFAGLAREFVMANPPGSPVMFHYGESFPDYLAAQEDLRPYPYLPDVARLEILLRQAYHDEDAPILGGEVLAGIAPEQLGDLRFVAHPALRFLASDFAAVSLTLANRNDDATVAIDPSQAEFAVVTRPHLETALTAVTAAQFEFLTCLAEGGALADAADRAFTIDEAFDLPATLALALAKGIFTAVLTEKDEP